MLEKRKTIVSVTSSSCSELLAMLRNLDKSGRLFTKQYIFIFIYLFK